MDGNSSGNRSTVFDHYEDQLNKKVEEHLKYLSKIYPLDEGPVFDLLTSYKKNMEAINHIPMLITNSLTDLFRIKKENFTSQFQQDISFLIKSKEVRELEEREIAVITQAVKDLMEALFSIIINKTGETLSSYLKWMPKSNDTANGTVEEVKDFFARLMYEIAKARAERDLYKEEVVSLKKAMTPQVSGKYRVLRVLEEAGKPLRPVEIASRLELAEVTVRRYLKDLMAEEFIARNESRKPYTYRLVDRNWLSRITGRRRK